MYIPFRCEYILNCMCSIMCLNTIETALTTVEHVQELRIICVPGPMHVCMYVHPMHLGVSVYLYVC